MWSVGKVHSPETLVGTSPIIPPFQANKFNSPAKEEGGLFTIEKKHNKSKFDKTCTNVNKCKLRLIGLRTRKKVKKLSAAINCRTFEVKFISKQYLI
jgi:hypothetical protein